MAPKWTCRNASPSISTGSPDGSPVSSSTYSTPDDGASPEVAAANSNVIDSTPFDRAVSTSTKCGVFEDEPPVVGSQDAPASVGAAVGDGDPPVGLGVPVSDGTTIVGESLRHPAAANASATSSAANRRDDIAPQLTPGLRAAGRAQLL